jgi:hypothetical protein
VGRAGSDAFERRRRTLVLMRNVSAFLAAAFFAASLVAAAGAQSASPTSSAQAEQAAAAATRAAQKINLEARNGSGVTGSVGLYQIGRTRTRIVVRLPASGKYRLVLHPGSDCSSNRTAALADVALAPTNFSMSRASMSSTIVSLPLEKVRSNYVVDVRDATNRAALSAACAKLR